MRWDSEASYKTDVKLLGGDGRVWLALDNLPPADVMSFDDERSEAEKLINVLSSLPRTHFRRVGFA